MLEDTLVRRSISRINPQIYIARFTELDVFIVSAK